MFYWRKSKWLTTQVYYLFVKLINCYPHQTIIEHNQFDSERSFWYIRVRDDKAHLERYEAQIISDPPPRLSTKNYCHYALNVFSEEVGTLVGLMLVSVTLATDRSIVGWSVSQRSRKQTSSHFECLGEYFFCRDYICASNLTKCTTKCDLKMAEETSSRPSLFTRMKGYLKEAPFFCKIIELVKSLDK